MHSKTVLDSETYFVVHFVDVKSILIKVSYVVLTTAFSTQSFNKSLHSFATIV